MNRVFLITVLIIVAACSSEKVKKGDQRDYTDKTEQTVTEDTPQVQQNEIESNSDSIEVLNMANRIIHLLDKKDLKGLSTLLKENDSIRFSPYAYVAADEDVRLGSYELNTISSKKMNWGSYDGSGNPISLTIPEYFEKFVYSHDYAHDSDVAISYNRFIGSGNSLNNLEEVYPDHFFVEYYFPGSKKYDLMDWSCLRIVFRKENNAFALVGIIHDQWTI